MTTSNPAKSKRPGCLRLLATSVVLLVLSVVWALFIAGDFRAYEVLGDSMVPTLQAGDRVVARKVAPETLKRDDLVVVDLPFEGGHELIKRLVALPGDTIAVRNWVFHVNGEAQPNPGERGPAWGGPRMPAIRLGPEAYFVLGDNRPVSYDSEEFGPIGPEAIQGVVVLRYKPWSRRGRLR